MHQSSAAATAVCDAREPAGEGGFISAGFAVGLGAARRKSRPACSNPVAVPALRDSLTVLAILVIGVLTAALVGPYLIDWNSHRQLIEQRLTAAAGTKVTVAGPIDLKLLPRPIFKFARVVIGVPAAGRPHVAIEEVDAEISLTALMRGELQVVDTTLKRPRLTLVETAGAGFSLPLPGDDDADRVALDHMRIEDGTVALDFADGRHLALSGLDAEAEATSLRGPFKATGRFGPADAPFRFIWPPEPSMAAGWC